MSFVGKLEDLPAPGLLSAIANGKKTGKLTVTRPNGYVVLVFRVGAIIYASSDAARETLGGLLVTQGHISKKVLSDALDQQHRVGEQRRVGKILLDMQALDVSLLEEALRQQSEAVLMQLFSWDSGYFKFEVLEEPENATDDVEVEVDLGDLLLQQGLPTQEVMMEVMRLLDEANREPSTSPARALNEGSMNSGLDTKILLATMSKLRSAPTTTDISQILLSAAREHFQRGVLFLPRGTEIHGMLQFGIDASPTAGLKKVTTLRIAGDPPSTLSTVAATRESFRGPLESNYWNEHLIRELGGEVPAESAVLPVVVGAQCALLLYGDNLPADEPIGPLGPLKILAAHAGLAIEKKALEKKLR